MTTARIEVDVFKNKRFTEKDLDTYKRLIVKEAYPWLYGKRLPPSLRVCIDAKIVDVDSVNWQSILTGQESRAGGKNPEFDAVRIDIRDNGFKLYEPAICLFETPEGELVPLNGRTRFEILVQRHGFKNIIAIIYKGRNGYTKKEIDSDCSIFGVSSNSNHNPAGKTRVDVVFREVNLAITRGWINLVGDTQQDLSTIRERVDKLCGTGILPPTVRDNLIHRILNNHDPQFTVKSWSTPGISDNWLTDHSYVTVKPKKNRNGRVIKKGIMYVCYSSQTGGKTFTDVAKIAFKYPQYEIRLVIHTGTLTGFNLELCYYTRIDEFRTFWINAIRWISNSFFGDCDDSDNRVVLYGALPALESIHDLDKIVKFVDKTPENPHGLTQSGKVINFENLQDIETVYNTIDLMEMEYAV